MEHFPTYSKPEEAEQRTYTLPPANDDPFQMVATFQSCTNITIESNAQQRVLVVRVRSFGTREADGDPSDRHTI